MGKPRLQLKDSFLFFLFFLISVIPRLPLVLLTPGHSDHRGFLRVGKAWFLEGTVGFHKPFSSPIATYLAGWLGVWSENLGLPYYYIYNFLFTCLTAVTLFFLFKVFSKYLDTQKSLLAVISFNFFSQFYVLSGAFAEVGLFVFFYVLSFYFFQKRKFWQAVLFVALATNTRIQGLALAVPMGLVFLYEDYKRKKTDQMIQKLAGCIVLGVLAFAIQFGVSGWSIFVQQYHVGELSSAKKIGAFFHRGLNILGPLGMFMVFGLLIRDRKVLLKAMKKNNDALVAALSVIFTWIMLLKAPWDSYHQIPVVLVLFFWAFHRIKTRWATAIFIVSALLPNLIQIQVKPWKMPPVKVSPGVIKANIEQKWFYQGGG